MVLMIQTLRLQKLTVVYTVGMKALNSLMAIFLQKAIFDVRRIKKWQDSDLIRK